MNAPLLLDALGRLEGQLEDSLRSRQWGCLESTVEELCLLLAAQARVQPEEVLRGRILRIQSLANQAVCLLEKEGARRLIADPSSNTRYFDRVSAFALEEGQAVQLSRLSRVLFVGSGSLPLSAVTLHQQFACPVTCLDVDLESNLLAQQLMRHLGLDIEMAWGRAERFPLGGFTHVFVASLIPHKERLLRRLHPRLTSQARVVVRFANGLGEIFNFPLQLSECGPFRPRQLLHHPQHLHQSWVLDV